MLNIFTQSHFFSDDIRVPRGMSSNFSILAAAHKCFQRYVFTSVILFDINKHDC